MTTTLATIFQFMTFGLFGANAPAPSPGDAVAWQMNAAGHVLVREASQTNAPTFSIDFLGASSGVIKSTSPCVLYQLVATNETATRRWLMVFFTGSVPVDGTVPSLQFQFAPGALIPFETPRGRTVRGPGVGGIGAGICWAISSTPGTLTLDAGAAFSVTTEYS